MCISKLRTVRETIESVVRNQSGHNLFLEKYCEFSDKKIVLNSFFDSSYDNFSFF